MESIQEAAIYLVKIYFFISIGHSAIFMIISTSNAAYGMRRGKRQKEIKKNRFSIWNGFIWPKFWFEILRGKDSNSRKRIRD